MRINVSRRSAALGVAFTLTVCSACRPGAEAPTAKFQPPASSAPTVSASSSAGSVVNLPAGTTPLRPLVFAGHRLPRNAAWTQGGFVVATHDELWRVLLGDKMVVQSILLARPLGHDAVVGASGSSPLVALGLDDGGVDIFRAAIRVRTIDGGPTDGGVLQLQFSADGRSLAVTRSDGTWPEKTSLYDTETGVERGKVDGGNIVFDDSGAFFTARSGLYEVSSGRVVFSWKEGFDGPGRKGKAPPKPIPWTSAMVVQDQAARGFVKGRAVFAGADEVVLVEPATAAVATIAATCGRGRRKVLSHLDVANGRVYGVCSDALLVTALDARTTERMVGGKFDNTPIPPKVLGVAGADKVIIQAMPELWLLDAKAKTFAPPTPTQLQSLELLDWGGLCSGRRTPRLDLTCSSRPLSDDGAHHLLMSGSAVELRRVAERNVEFTLGGLSSNFTLAPRGRGFDVFGSGTKGVQGAPRYRIGDGPKGGPLQPATKTCGGGEQNFHSAVDGGTVYTGYAARQVTACFCRDGGCEALAIGTANFFFAAAPDGTTLSFLPNTAMTESSLHLQRGGKELARATIPGFCKTAALGASGRIFLGCAPRTFAEDFVLELHPKTLAVLGRRMAPLGSVVHLDASADKLAITPSDQGGVATIVPLDWIVEARSSVHSTVHLGSRGALIDRGGTLEVLGDPEDVLPLVRCWNGERLFGVGACRSALEFAP
jgi:hypothetical protein